ncbi:alcohol dehydrogenase family protein [Leucothrix mucor]|uniref:alcohol dehydrogenase family protein n=1 Tax=Leucothrix mucor TaxID=45248 RepID=UPI0003B6280E|nr:alcohol dehydrogenase family protein [Leucothrix mucor]
MTIPQVMQGIYLTGHGGFEKLEFSADIPVPIPKAGEVLIHVRGAGVNNTDINTRTAWYSKAVTSATDAGAESGFDASADNDGSWSGEPLIFPMIQGADCCGYVVAVGEGVSESRIGERVLVRTMQADTATDENYKCITLGSERNGAFAQYMTAASHHSLKVDCDWSDAELASIPCAYSTAEGMLHRAAVGQETVLITGASGGVGSAAIQLAKRRGATVIAVSGAAKADEVKALGADQVVDRNCDLVATLGKNAVDVVVDLVAGAAWPSLLEILKGGGRYVASGAIAGPIVELDVRTLYLKDLSLLGSTYQSDVVFENLIGYIERGEIRPVVAKTYPLKNIVEAQTDFLAKKHTGKLVLIPE